MTQELASYRALTERLLFLVTRMPQVIAWQVDQAASLLATSEPSILEFVANTKTFAAATDKFATATAAYPKDISAERDAAIIQLHEAVTAERKATIDQTAAAVTAQRDAILKELDTRIATTSDDCGRERRGRSCAGSRGHLCSTMRRNKRCRRPKRPRNG